MEHESGEMELWESASQEEAAAHWSRVLQAGADLIRARFDLGGVVFRALQRSQYGDGVVSRMAAELSRRSGKNVSTTVLYDSARLYEGFGGDYGRIDTLQSRLSFPLQYSYLVRRCLPLVTQATAWNPQEWAARQDVETGYLERVVAEIEERFVLDQARVAASGESSGAEPAVERDGFVQACQESVAYQEVAIHTLCGRIHEALGYLERKASMLTVRDRQQLQGYASRLCELAQRQETLSAVSKSAA